MTILIEDVNKPKLFLFGACDLWDSVSIPLIRRDFFIDGYYVGDQNGLDFEYLNRPEFSTSLVSLYTEPGSLAERVYDSIYKIKEPSASQLEMFKEIVKYPFLKYFKNNATKDDFLILSFSSELYTKFYKDREKFTINPKIIKCKNESIELEWFFEEYLYKEIYHVPFDDMVSINETYDFLKDFARDIYEIFQDRIILVDTHLTEMSIADKDYKIEKIKMFCEERIPFYKTSRIIQDQRDHNYARRCLDIVLNKFRKSYKSDVPLITVDNSYIFNDLTHPWGAAPFHLHKSSTFKIGEKIHEALIKKQGERSCQTKN